MNFIFFRFANEIVEAYELIILIQFVISTSMISFSTYHLSLVATDFFDILFDLALLNCLLIQLFIYCYFGSEITAYVSKFFNFYINKFLKSRKKINILFYYWLF